MNKTKEKLNSLYGQMVGGNTAFDVCSRKVREISCARCLHYEKCVRNGGSPVSPLGAYIAWLDLHALPIIESKLSPVCGNGIILEGDTPFEWESKGNVFAVIRAYDRKHPNSRVCRVLLEDAVKDIEQLTEMILKAYVSKKGKSRK